jgi:hypothetical protein
MIMTLSPNIFIIIILSNSSSETARNHNLITVHFHLLIPKPNPVNRNIHRNTTRIRSGLVRTLALSSPQPFHSLLHHVRDESPQFFDSHLHHDEILRGPLLLLLLLLGRRDIPSHVVVKSWRTRRR